MGGLMHEHFKNASQRSCEDLYRVTFQGQIAVNEAPWHGAEMIDKLEPGEEVALLEEDDTACWRKVVRACGTGWVQLHCETWGLLLEKSSILNEKTKQTKTRVSSHEVLQSRVL